MRRPKRWSDGKFRWAFAVSLCVHATVFALVFRPAGEAAGPADTPEKTRVDVIIPERELPPPRALEPELAPPSPPREALLTDRFIVVPEKDADDRVVWDPDGARKPVELPDGKNIIVKPDDPRELPEVTFVDYQVPPVLVKEVQPRYPELAAASGVEADVVLLVYINEKGAVEHVVVQSSSGFAAIDEEAVRAARKCEFKPALQNGAPVAAWYSLVMEFKK